MQKLSLALDESSKQNKKKLAKGLLVNALIHRDYFIKDSIKVFFFDDRIEIRSPGKLPNNLTVDQIRRGVRRSRNVLLASFATYLLNFRGIGSGIERAFKAWPLLSWVNNTESEEVVVAIELTPTNSVMTARRSNLQ